MKHTTGPLETIIAAMEADGTDHYDPVRFCFIKSLARRAEGKSESLSLRIQEKALAAMADYRNTYENAQKETQKVMTHICKAFPETEAIIWKLFTKNEFTQIVRLEKALSRRHPKPDFSGLMAHIKNSAPHVTQSHSRISLEDLMLRQEQDAIASVNPTGPGRNVSKNQKSSRMPSFQQFKTAMRKSHTHRMVAGAIRDCPENAGPHNAQMLAVNSLSTLRRICPAYLEQFVAHISTLICLKQAGADLGKYRSKKRKK